MTITRNGLPFLPSLSITACWLRRRESRNVNALHVAVSREDSRCRSSARSTRPAVPAAPPRNIVGILLLLASLHSPTALGQSPPRTPTTPSTPKAPQKEHISLWHDNKVNDPFFWLREKNNPEVRKYLEAENAYTEAMTAEIQPFADALYKEMLGHIKQTDLGVPLRRGPFYYYSRMQEGKQYPIRCRKKAAPDGSFNEKGHGRGDPGSK